jgi:hypothetical protein
MSEDYFVNEIYAYINGKGQKVYTPNFQFADIMAKKYNTDGVYIEKT